MATWENIQHFKPEEFDSPDRSGSGLLMDEHFVSLLDQIRSKVKFALVITSGYRTQAHNREVGGKSESAHCTGHAADIACLTSRQRYAVVKAALELGITRIGIGDTFVHLDVDHELPANCIWTY